jgi:hypothetical protein
MTFLTFDLFLVSYGANFHLGFRVGEVYYASLKAGWAICAKSTTAIKRQLDFNKKHGMLLPQSPSYLPASS